MTKIISENRENNSSLLYNLYKNNYIQSYYFSFEINKKNENELTYIYDIYIK